MIFQKIEFHNVEELLPEAGGYRMSRLPGAVREKMNPKARDITAFYGTGVELRFKIRSGEADVYLRYEKNGPLPVFLYYGAFQGGFEHTAYQVGPEEFCIHVTQSPRLAELKRITAERGLPFSPEVIRLVLPSGTPRFVRVEGDVEPPAREDLPKKTYLAYGSSITHGSLALGMPHTYVFQIARRLGADYLNLGFPDSALLEKEVAEYIVSRKDWDFATFELGINMLFRFTNEEFEQRVKDFVAVLAADPRPIFVTSLFGIAKLNPQVEPFREIVRRQVHPPLIFTEGTALLHEQDCVSEDLVHPSLEGAALIAARWGDVMAAHLKQEGGSL